jgi:hypothetical protein
LFLGPAGREKQQMIEQGREPNGAESEAGSRRRTPVSPSGVIEIRQRVGVAETEGSDLGKLLALLVAVTLACGVAAGVTVNLAPAYTDNSSDGY